MRRKPIFARKHLRMSTDRKHEGKIQEWLAAEPTKFKLVQALLCAASEKISYTFCDLGFHPANGEILVAVGAAEVALLSCEED